MLFKQCGKSQEPQREGEERRGGSEERMEVNPEFQSCYCRHVLFLKRKSAHSSRVFKLCIWCQKLLTLKDHIKHQSWEMNPHGG